MLKEDKYKNKLNLIKTRDKREGNLFFQPFFIFYRNYKKMSPKSLFLTANLSRCKQTTNSKKNIKNVRRRILGKGFILKSKIQINERGLHQRGRKRSFRHYLMFNFKKVNAQKYIIISKNNKIKFP